MGVFDLLENRIVLPVIYDTTIYLDHILTTYFFGFGNRFYNKDSTSDAFNYKLKDEKNMEISETIFKVLKKIDLSSSYKSAFFGEELKKVGMYIPMREKENLKKVICQ